MSEAKARESIEEYLNKHGLNAYDLEEIKRHHVQQLPDMGGIFRFGPNLYQVIQLDLNGEMKFKQIGSIVKDGNYASRKDLECLDGVLIEQMD